MCNPYTLGMHLSDQEKAEGGFRVAFIIFIMGYVWAVLWSLLIIRAQCVGKKEAK